MENNINIAEILKDCPKGMELYSSIYGEVKFYKIDIDNESYPIAVKNSKGIVYFAEDGRYSTAFDTAECLLFPSSKMRDWTKFFKRGDVVYNPSTGTLAIFEGWADSDYTNFNTSINKYSDDTWHDGKVCITDPFIKVDIESHDKFIADAAEHYNGKYNPNTLQVEPIKPTCPFKPFDKVLVRDNDKQNWRASLFAYYDENAKYHYVCIPYINTQCIPYNEQTAHLLGTTDPYTEGGSE